MAHDKKKAYEGFKLKSDTVGERDARLKRAQKNAQSEMTNEMFALKDPAFREACRNLALARPDWAGYEPGLDEAEDRRFASAINAIASRRQASKFRNGYGAAARAAGKSRRKEPGQ